MFSSFVSLLWKGDGGGLKITTADGKAGCSAPTNRACPDEADFRAASAITVVPPCRIGA